MDLKRINLSILLALVCANAYAMKSPQKNHPSYSLQNNRSQTLATFVNHVKIWGTSALLLGSLGYCIYNPESVRKSWEYIKGIPFPILGIFASYFVINNFINQHSINELYTEITNLRHALQNDYMTRDQITEHVGIIKDQLIATINRQLNDLKKEYFNKADIEQKIHEVKSYIDLIKDDLGHANLKKLQRKIETLQQSVDGLLHLNDLYEQASQLVELNTLLKDAVVTYGLPQPQIFEDPDKNKYANDRSWMKAFRKACQILF